MDEALINGAERYAIVDITKEEKIIWPKTK
jgi:hypothetical protein